MKNHKGNWALLIVTLAIIAFALGVACKTSSAPSAITGLATKAGLDDKIPYAKEIADICNYKIDNKCTKKSYDKCVQDLGKSVAAKGEKFGKALECRAKCTKTADSCDAYKTCGDKC